MLIVFSYSCEKDQDLNLSETSTIDNQSTTPRSVDLEQCIPDEFNSTVGRSMAWHIYQKYAEDKPSVILNGFPDFESSISVHCEVESNGITFVPVVPMEAVEDLPSSSSIFIVTYSTDGEYEYLDLPRQSFEQNIELGLSFIVYNNEFELPHEEIDYIFDALDFAVQCKGTDMSERENLYRNSCRGRIKCPGDFCFGNWVKGIFKGIVNTIRNILANIRPTGGRLDDDLSGHGTIYPPAAGIGNTGSNSTNNGSNSDPNFIDNLTLIRSCLGFDDYDDNTSPPHPNTQFCSTWINYYENCLQNGENFDVNNYFAAADDWAFHMTQSQYAQNGTFQNVISNTLLCVDEESYTCVDAVNEFNDKHSLNLSSYQISQIINSLSCGSGIGLDQTIEDEINSLGLLTDDGLPDILDTDNGEYNGPIANIPSCIELPDGTQINIDFNLGSDQPIAECLVQAFYEALICATAAGHNINDIYISSTTDGVHSPTSNHSKALAIDFSRINGVKMINMNAQELQAVQALQDCLENVNGIRENFGPGLKNKLGKPYNVGGHKDHIHFSINSWTTCNYNDISC